MKGLERKLELMTSALDRAEQQISSMKKDISAAEQDKARLEAALASASVGQNGVEGGPVSPQNGAGSGGAGPGSNGSSQLCRTCRERPASCVVMPCMHLLYCRPCLDEAHKTAKVCPGCETPCLSVMDVQLSLQ